VWRLRPGDTVVVRSSEGGCDRFGWNPDSRDPVRDIGDLCANERVEQAGGRYRVRVVPEVLFPENEPRRQEVSSYLKRADEEDTEETEKLKQAILDAAHYRKNDWRRPGAYGENWLLMESAWVPRPKDRAWASPDEPEQDDSESQTQRQTLREHTQGVVDKAREFAVGCGVNGGISQSIEFAARMHDQGKQDERFQYMLSPQATDEPLAKSDKVSRKEWERRRQDAGYPKGARHEFASVALVKEFDARPEEVDAELALYLIGTHHGYGRPFPPVWHDEGKKIRAGVEGRTLEAKDVHRVAHIDSDWVDRYWALTRKFGWWGLPYLEAILRRADCVQSREEQEGK
jgi:CRISPR-associated endonuclease/helicase Cas3